MEEALLRLRRVKKRRVLFSFCMVNVLIIPRKIKEKASNQ